MFVERSTTRSQALLAVVPSERRTTTLYAMGRYFSWVHTTGGPGTMGAHGGGWEVKVGFQSSSWRSLLTLRSALFGLGSSYLVVGLQRDRHTEAAARVRAEARA